MTTSPVSPGAAVVVRESNDLPAPLELTPTQRLQAATEIADALSSVIEQKHLYVELNGKRHVLAEGWQVLANLMNVGLEVEWTRRMQDPKGWEARVVARRQDGQILGAAEAQCCQDEPRWSRQPDYALRSMAQTRATSRALRQSIGFIVKLSGFEATPAEEMDFQSHEEGGGKPPAHPTTEGKPSPSSSGFTSGEPIWLDEKLGFGQFKDKTWRDLLNGEPGGRGEQWLDWAISHIDRESVKIRVSTIVDMRNARASA